MSKPEPPQQTETDVPSRLPAPVGKSREVAVGDDVSIIERRLPEVRALVGTLLLTLAACGQSLPASSPGANVVAKNVTTSDGIVVMSACTPTGPELCFNANDDNCNA